MLFSDSASTGSIFVSASTHHREVSRLFEGRVQFGLVECGRTAGQCPRDPQLCRHASQIPYSVYYDNGVEEVVAGHLNPSEIKGFLEDKLEPIGN